MSTDPSPTVRCLIIGNHPTLHWLDESRSTPGAPWAVCSWFADGDHSVVPLARAREKYPHHVPCGSCFTDRQLPDEPASFTSRFDDLLRQSSRELYDDHPDLKKSPVLVPTPNTIDDGDVRRFFAAVDEGLVTLHRGGKFNTSDRPKSGGRWSLLSRSKQGGWYNAEYLPQIAAYAEAVLELGYPRERVLFELPSKSLQLDLAILDDNGRVVVLGEAKRDVAMLERLQNAVLTRFSAVEPDVTTKKRGDEARQLAWRLWKVQPEYCWLIAPGRRDALACSYGPLAFAPATSLPPASELGLDHLPPTLLVPPDLS